MAIGKKVSPAKFLGALALAGGIAQGATSIIGGIREKGRIARDKRRAKNKVPTAQDNELFYKLINNLIEIFIIKI